MPNALASPAFEQFSIESADGVHVHVTSGTRAHLTVLDRDRNVLEQHKHLKGVDILGLRSQYFTVRPLREVEHS